MRQIGKRMALCTAAVLALGVAEARGDVTLTLGDDVTIPNANCRADITLSLASGGAEVAGVQIDMLFPSPAFSLFNPDVRCTLAPGLHGQVSSAITTSPPPPAGMQRLRILVLDLASVEPYPDGVLATCTLRPNSGTALGNHTLTAEGADSSDPAGIALPTTGVNGEITVSPAAWCCP